MGPHSLGPSGPKHLSPTHDTSNPLMNRIDNTRYRFILESPYFKILWFSPNAFTLEARYDPGSCRGTIAFNVLMPHKKVKTGTIQ